MCWEESRPWVSALRQQGYSVPWVDEPKAELKAPATGFEADLLVVDLTRLPDQGGDVPDALAAADVLAGVPIVMVTSDGKQVDGLGAAVTFAGPDTMIAAVETALAEKQQA